MSTHIFVLRLTHTQTVTGSETMKTDPYKDHTENLKDWKDLTVLFEDRFNDALGNNYSMEAKITIFKEVQEVGAEDKKDIEKFKDEAKMATKELQSWAEDIGEESKRMEKKIRKLYLFRNNKDRGS